MNAQTHPHPAEQAHLGITGLSEKATILVVDDTPDNLILMNGLLKDDYKVKVANSGEKALKIALSDTPPSLILLDIMMPDIDGYEVCRRLKLDPKTMDIPVIFLTAKVEMEDEKRGLELGAVDYITKPISPPIMLARVHNMLEMRLLQKALQQQNVVLEQRVSERTAALLASNLETIFTMTRAAEFKDEDTGAHVQRISYYSSELAKQLGLDAEFIDRIFVASPMHDIGKIGVPDHILLKPGGFDPQEWEVMQNHVTMGGMILGNSNSPYLMMAAEIALNHHERWNGSGYPGNKVGEAIPLAARIMNICDIYDALRSKRPYKPAFDHEKAMEIITLGDGRTDPSHFDPAIHATFTKNHEVFRDIFDRYAETDQAAVPASPR